MTTSLPPTNAVEQQEKQQQQQQQQLSPAAAVPACRSSSAVQVFVRVRPLIQEETRECHTCMDYKIVTTNNKTGDDGSASNNNASSTWSLQVKLPPKKKAANFNNIINNPAFQIPPRLLQRQQREQWKVFDGFSSVLTPECNNKDVYQATVKPLLPLLLQQQQEPLPVSSAPPSCCVFTYGHTGSGKTHTLLGYDKHNGNLGIYKYAARDLFAMLEQQNEALQLLDDDDDDDSDQRRIVLIRATELYKDKARDLLTTAAGDADNNNDCCTIREDKYGVAHVRGPFIEDDQGRLDPKPLGRLCFSADQVIACVDQACTSRRTGKSTHHNQSSRSHLVLELEIGVTPAFIEQRNLVTKQETHLTRLQWLQTERMLGKHNERKHPIWTEEYATSPKKLRQDISKYESLVHKSRNKLREMEQDLVSGGGGGTLVFCDLAGNEYARDTATSTQQEMEEAAEINKSLLAVKEMIRSLMMKTSSSDGGGHRHHHVSYRDSKLSMMLQRHLGGQGNNHRNNSMGKDHNNKNGRRAVMLGHISPSEEFVRKTINTLTYCSMVADTNEKSNKKSSSKNTNKK